MRIKAEEPSIKDMINKIKTRSHFIEAGVGVGISFLGGGVAPHASFGTGREIRDSDLVTFISGITGQDVKVTAEKLSASLDAITSQGTLREFIKEREITKRPSNSVHHEAWSASLCLGPDGRLNPSFMPYIEEDGRRVSAIISPDLFRGMNMITNFLSSDYAVQKQDFNKKLLASSKTPLDKTLDKFKSSPELKDKAHEVTEKLVQGDEEARNAVYKLEVQAKDELGLKEESIFGRIGNFLGNLFIKEDDEDLKPFKSLKPEEKLEPANLMRAIYGKYDLNAG